MLLLNVSKHRNHQFKFYDMLALIALSNIYEFHCVCMTNNNQIDYYVSSILTVLVFFGH